MRSRFTVINLLRSILAVAFRKQCRTQVVVWVYPLVPRDVFVVDNEFLADYALAYDFRG